LVPDCIGQSNSTFAHEAFALYTAFSLSLCCVREFCNLTRHRQRDTPKVSLQHLFDLLCHPPQVQLLRGRGLNGILRLLQLGL